MWLFLRLCSHNPNSEVSAIRTLPILDPMALSSFPLLYTDRLPFFSKSIAKSQRGMRIGWKSILLDMLKKGSRAPLVFGSGLRSHPPGDQIQLPFHCQTKGHYLLKAGHLQLSNSLLLVSMFCCFQSHMLLQKLAVSCCCSLMLFSLWCVWGPLFASKTVIPCLPGMFPRCIPLLSLF